MIVLVSSNFTVISHQHFESANSCCYVTKCVYVVQVIRFCALGSGQCSITIFEVCFSTLCDVRSTSDNNVSYNTMIAGWFHYFPGEVSRRIRKVNLNISETINQLRGNPCLVIKQDPSLRLPKGNSIQRYTWMYREARSEVSSSKL